MKANLNWWRKHFESIPKPNWSLKHTSNCSKPRVFDSQWEYFKDRHVHEAVATLHHFKAVGQVQAYQYPLRKLPWQYHGRRGIPRNYTTWPSKVLDKKGHPGKFEIWGIIMSLGITSNWREWKTQTTQNSQENKLDVERIRIVRITLQLYKVLWHIQWNSILRCKIITIEIIYASYSETSLCLSRSRMYTRDTTNVFIPQGEHKRLGRLS